MKRRIIYISYETGTRILVRELQPHEIKVYTETRLIYNEYPCVTGFGWQKSWNDTLKYMQCFVHSERRHRNFLFKFGVALWILLIGWGIKGSKPGSVSYWLPHYDDFYFCKFFIVFHIVSVFFINFSLYSSYNVSVNPTWRL